jgi:hypothetical protein
LPILALDGPPPSQLTPQNELPILHKTSQAYQSWHRLLPHIPRLSRFTLGQKIDQLFLDLLELLLLACYSRGIDKQRAIDKASVKLDTLKYVLSMAWQLRLIDNKKYQHLGSPLVEVGRMLGAWRRSVTALAAQQNLHR